MKKKRKLLTSLKRAITGILCGAVIATSTFSNYSMVTHAAGFNSVIQNTVVSLVDAGAYKVGEIAGSSIGGPVGGVVLGTLASKGANYFVNASSTGVEGNTTYNIMNGNIYNINDSFNTTNYYDYYDYSYNDNSQTWNYNFYNPINNNYNTTNEFYYNPEYSTYYYNTYQGDTITNNYVTDNTTYVSYYIVEKSADEIISQQYFEIYFKLPDGRNSFNLSKEDIWGQYALSNYSSYVNVAEDDGITLGLWHLDGDLKDSSYWNNSTGSSYTATYNDARFEGGKYLKNAGDYFTLKLDKATLPSTWTLEWFEFTPQKTDPSLTDSFDKAGSWSEKVRYNPLYTKGLDSNGVYVPPSASPGMIDRTREAYYTRTFYKYTGTSGLSDVDIYGSSIYGSINHYAIVCSGGKYFYYANGNKVECDVSDPTASYLGDGVSVSTSSIKFYTGSRYTSPVDKWTDYEYKDMAVGQSQVGTNPSSSNFTKANYHIFDHENRHYRYRYCTYFNYESIIDEVRLSKGAIYSDNFTPTNQVYTTNTVLVTPSDPEKNEISFKSSRELGTVRVGGARPTYPDNNSVYISLDDDSIVKSIQQYQDNGWYNIDAALYDGTKWITLLGYDLSTLQLRKPLSIVKNCNIKVENTDEGILFTPTHSATCFTSVISIDGKTHCIDGMDTYLYKDVKDGQKYKIFMSCTHRINDDQITKKTMPVTWTYKGSGESGGEQPTVITDCTLRVENTDTGILCTPNHSDTCALRNIYIDNVKYDFDVTGNFLFNSAVDGQTYKIYMKCVHVKDEDSVTRIGRTVSWTYHNNNDPGGTQPEPPDDSNNSNNNSGGNSGGSSGDNSDDDSSGGILGAIGNLLKTLFGAISKIITPLLDGITELLGSIIDGLANITSFGTKFGEFLSGAFIFIPDEIITVLTLGVSLAILAIIFRILKR